MIIFSGHIQLLYGTCYNTELKHLRALVCQLLIGINTLIFHTEAIMIFNDCCEVFRNRCDSMMKLGTKAENC